MQQKKKGWVLLLIAALLFAIGMLLLSTTVGFANHERAKSQNIKILSEPTKETVITITKKEVILGLPDAQVVTFSDTKSMEPTIKATAKGIIVPVTIEMLQPGDIIVFSYHSHVIVHRIIAIENDEQGTYLITKGDNLKNQDPVKIRQEHIIGKLVALIY
ncbi:MAG: signal peptidase I [Candidatus Woesearchaeota archaeon]